VWRCISVDKIIEVDGQLEYRQLGNTDLQVSAFGLGCGRLGSVTQVGGNQAALRLIGSALDAGVTFFDTADIYGQGASETLLGQATRSRRDQVVIATKAGYCLSPLGSIARRLKPLLRRIIRLSPGFAKTVTKVRAAQHQQSFSADYLAGRIEASLRRLQTDALDLFQLHSPPTAVLERGEVFEALAKFRAAGKIRHYGIACLSATDASLWLDQPGVAAIQLELSLLSPQVIGAMPQSAQAKGVGIIARQALAGGLLLRSAGELRPEHCPSREEDFKTLRAWLERLEKLASEANCSVRELALRYMVQLEGVSSTLIGTTDVAHLQQNLAVLGGPALAPDILRHIPAALGVPNLSVNSGDPD
jgi:aryl-alcohol dehydrogenase-like predicted oxidoreductase